MRMVPSVGMTCSVLRWLFRVVDNQDRNALGGGLQLQAELLFYSSHEWRSRSRWSLQRWVLQSRSGCSNSRLLVCIGRPVKAEHVIAFQASLVHYGSPYPL